MIYLDHAATSFEKPLPVKQAMLRAMECCANPGRGGYEAAMAAAETVFRCRETAGKLFRCSPEQVSLENLTEERLAAATSTTSPGLTR